MVVTTLYLVVYAVAILMLVSLGLAVIFGMMKVINLAHGEFMMLGAYTCFFCVNAGAPLWVGFLAAAVAVGLFGIIVERIMIQFLYGRIVDTLLATWGLSLFLVGLVTTLLGPTARSVPTQFGSVSFGGTSFSTYNFVLIAMAIGMVALTWVLARYTKAGLIVRGTMQDATIASALGVNRRLVFTSTFGYGAALAGLAGAVLVPITGASPTLGLFFVAKSFINVIIGGHLPLIGTVAASSLLGSIDGFVSFIWSSVIGEVTMLIVAVILLRLLPLGITGRMRSGL
jgi:branched-subunit amino acid ABC-type transport system permease component